MSIKQNANILPLLEVIYVFRAWVEVNEYKATDVFWSINIRHSSTKASLIKKCTVLSLYGTYISPCKLEHLYLFIDFYFVKFICSLFFIKQSPPVPQAVHMTEPMDLQCVRCIARC
jgi:hypothetical protein